MPAFTTNSFILLFQLGLTLTITLLLNSLLRFSIQIPKRLDTRRGRTYVAIIRSLISIVIFTVALHIIFIILGINIIPLLASAGIIGIAIGIGARPFIEDIISGLFLLTQANLAIGDYVNVGTGLEGIIEAIGIRTLTVRGVNGAIYIISNGQVKQVINYSRGNAIVFVDIPVKAGQNIDMILKIFNKTLQSFFDNTKTNYNITSDSRVWGIQNIQIPNCIIIRVVLIVPPHLREDIDKEYRYRIIKEFEKQNLQFT